MQVPLSLPRRVRAVAIALMLSACPSHTPGPVASSSVAAVRGGTLRVALADDVTSLDPHRATAPSAWFFARALHRGLLAFPNAPAPQGASPVPDLATSFDVTTDGLRYTFHLRDASFGPPASRAIVAEDVRASIARVLRADVGIARYLWVIAGGEAYARRSAQQIEGIEVPDPHTVVINLVRASADLPWILAHPQIAVLPASLAEGPVDPSTISPSGPYELERYQPERSITLARDLAWRDDPVRAANVDRIEATIGVDAARAVKQARAGVIDLVLDLGPPDVPEPIGLPGARATRNCIRYLFFSPARPRPARFPSRAVFAKLFGSTAGGLLPPTVTGTSSSLVPFAVPDNKGVPNAILTVGDSPRDRHEAALVKRAFAGVKIAITVKTIPPSMVAYTYRKLETQAGIATWCADWPGLAGRNVLGPIAGVVRAPLPAPCGPSARVSISRALTAAQAAPQDTAAQRWRSVDRVVMRSCAILPLYQPPEFAVIAKSVRGFTSVPMFPRGDPTGLWLGG